MSGRTITTRRRIAVVAVTAIALAPFAACGDDSTSDGSTPATTVAGGSASAQSAALALLPAIDPAQTLPPNDIGGLRRIYDPALETMGLRLTRGALIDLSDDGYKPSNTGTHLALYVEPIDDNYTNEQYVEGLFTVSALITPDVFSRWSDVESYDICQEPPSSIDDKDEPLPYTQINLTRAVSDSIDWPNSDLVDMLAAARLEPDFKLVVNKDLRNDPTYVAANDAAVTKAAATPD